MTDLRAFAQANGWSNTVTRVGRGLQRRLRDRVTARQLQAPGFRAGRAPRVFGISRMQVGEDFNAGDGLWLEAVLHYAGQEFAPQLVIGSHARLSDNVHIACLAHVSIGAHLLCGSNVLISDHTHGRMDESAAASDPATPPALRPLHSRAPVRIGDNVWIGDGAAILPGADLGDGCVIGANAVVNGAVPPGSIAVGAPARLIRQWNTESRTWEPFHGESGRLDKLARC